jgi:nucleotide-binding universal stress UspA family protein
MCVVLLTRRISKILVCIDGSKESNVAAHYSIALAKKYHAQLIALSVMRLPVITDGSFWTAETMKEWQAETRLQTLEWLNLVSENARKYDFEINARLIEHSEPAERSIVDYAEKENVDLIIVGTKGRSGFKKLLLGSVALGVVTFAHCPVIVVR